MLTGILVPIAFFAAALAIIYLVVTAKNRERMAMIEKGVNPKDFITKPKTRSYLNGIITWGLLLVGIGLGLFFGSLLDTYTNIPEEPAYFACALFFGGLGLVLAYFIAKKRLENKQD
jgi:ABC-type Fe3+-siderophore transport system permease subunit